MRIGPDRTVTDREAQSSIAAPLPLDTAYGRYRWAVAARESFPGDLYEQALSRYRADWPAGFRGVNEKRDWIALPSDHPVHVALVTDPGRVASHAAFVSRTVTIGGLPYAACGVIGLFTEPGHAWLAPRILSFVKDHLVPASRSDIAMGFCDDALVRWYTRLGLSHIEQARVRVDPRDADPVIVTDEVLMARALSPRGAAGLDQIRNGAELYFGSRPTW